jgi:predicted DNA-binding ribbon-helix-helix protein
MKSSIKKRTVIIGGQKTSVTLEDVFWKGLQEIADKRGETRSHLLTTIDRKRRFANLSSAIRQSILKFYMDQFVRQRAAANRATRSGARPWREDR